MKKSFMVEAIPMTLPTLTKLKLPVDAVASGELEMI